jgi:hypothetical protein
MFRRHGRLFSSLSMSQAAVHRPPARFDGSVVPGAKPAPFPEGFHTTKTENGRSVDSRLPAGF